MPATAQRIRLLDVIGDNPFNEPESCTSVKGPARKVTAHIIDDLNNSYSAGTFTEGSSSKMFISKYSAEWTNYLRPGAAIGGYHKCCFCRKPCIG